MACAAVWRLFDRVLDRVDVAAVLDLASPCRSRPEPGPCPSRKSCPRFPSAFAPLARPPGPLRCGRRQVPSSSCTRRRAVGVALHLLNFVLRQAGRRFDLTLHFLAVFRSFAETFKMPFASMSKLTSIFGMPRGACSMSTRSNFASSRLSARHRTFALIDLNRHRFLVVVPRSRTSRSCASDFVLRSTSFVMTPPRVSMPRDSGRDIEQEYSDFEPSRS